MKSRRAQSLIEVTVGLVVLAPVLLVLVDLSIAFWAAQSNDTECRNAAQAASSGPPTEANARAQSVLQNWNSHNQSKIIGQIQLAEPVNVEIKHAPQPQVDLKTGERFNPGGTVTGNITVSTEVPFNPFLIHFASGGKSPIRVRSTHSFPITYIQPPG
jgi:hypothetical protein